MTRFSAIVAGEESLLIGCCDMLLARGNTIAAVVSRTPEIRSWAQARGLRLHADFSGLEEDCDWLLSIANLRIIAPHTLSRARLGAVNFHDGPLPERAGLNVPNWAIIEGAQSHGISWHLIEGGVDEGDLLAERRFDIAGDETAFSLNARCYGAALDSFPEVLDQLESGQLSRRPQDLAARSYHARDALPAGGGILDPDQPAETLARLVRGLDMGGYWNPVTCAKIDLGGTVAAVGRAEVIAAPGSPAPQNMTAAAPAVAGQVIARDEDGLTIACGKGQLRLFGLSTPFGRRLRVSELPTPGQILPLPTPELTARRSADLMARRRSQAQWRRLLGQLPQPLPIPLEEGPSVSSEEPPETPTHHRQTLDLGEAVRALRLSQIASRLLAFGLLSTGETEGAISLSLPQLRTEAESGVLCGWVAVGAARDETLSVVETRIDTVLTLAETQGGFAIDLALRDPAIALAAPPRIALALGTRTPPEGAALSLLLPAEGGAAELCADARVLSAEAFALLAARLGFLLSQSADLSPGAAPLLARLPVLPAAEKSLLLQDWNDTRCPFDADLTIHGAIEAQVARTPSATAVLFEDQSLSYGELDARANRLAHQLRACGVRRGSHVGIHLRRGPDLVVATLATFKAGGAYVPLDPAYPADRIAHYISDSAAGVILTDSALARALPSHAAQVICLDQIDLREGQSAPLPQAPDPDASTGQDRAYLIYTSGSTGLPKGVMVRHDNVANFFVAMDEVIPHRPGDTWLAVTSLSFDISVLELFWTLARGFRLVIAGDENRLELARGPLPLSDRRMDFNLFYWGNDDGPGPRKYELLLEGAKFADAHGFNAVWTPERHFHAFGGPYPNPSVTGAAVAAVTRNIGVRAGSCVAPLHHPARIAEEWAVIDNLTGGRAGLGFASGWQPDDFVLRPENTPPANKPAMFDAIETVRALWRGEEVEFARADGSRHSVLTQPRPVSKALPVWVTTAGNPETWREAGRVGANVLTHLLGQSIDEVAQKIAIYHEALGEAGHDPADFAVTLMLHTYIAPTREAARETARGPMKDYLRSAAALIKQYAWAFPAFKKPAGVENAFDMDLGILSADELEAILDFAFERYFEESGLFGTITDALSRVEQLKRIGVDEIACLIDYGIAPQTVMAGLRPLAEVLRLSNRRTVLDADDFSLAAQILRHGVTHMQCTPSMARMICLHPEAGAALSRLDHLLLGGEALPGDLVSALRRHTGAQLHNMYGPTETTIWSTTDTVPARPAPVAAIGRAIANTTLYLLDEEGAPVPLGAAGELCIGGAGVTDGYWQRDALTRERFPADPFAAPGARLYRTGDLARWRMDGRLDFLGRSDHQVKLRGQRIELGEIETALAACPGITGAVVLARRLGQGDALVAYVTARGPVDEAELRASLSRQLAEVMVPARILRIDQFPLTPNKKIDRKALPDPASGAAADRPATADAGTSEAPFPASLDSTTGAAIAQIWQRLLGVGQLGAQDNFFDLGGHSLLAVQAHRDIRTALGVSGLSITDIFRFPRLGALTDHVQGLLGGDMGAVQADIGSDKSGQAVEDAAIGSVGRAAIMAQRRAMRAARVQARG